VKLFYMTDVADLIVSEGFGPSDRAGFATPTARGGYVSDRPVGMAEGALGDQMLEVLFPDTLDLTDYELTGDGRLWGGREWCVPTPVLNSHASVRQLDGDEADEAWLRSWLTPLT